MNPLEELIRDTLIEHAEDTPQFRRLATGRTLEPRPVKRKRQLLILVVANLALLAAALVVVHRMSGTRVAPAGPSIPSGTQPVSFHGTQVFVPHSWPVVESYTSCDRFTGNFVSIPMGSAPSVSCSPPADLSRLSVVEFHTLSSPGGRQLASLAREETNNERSVRRGSVETQDKRRMEIVVFVEQGVVISVTSPNAMLASQIVDTARALSVDSLGCAAHVAALTPKGPAKRAGSKNELVPGTPTSAVVCFYSDYWLGRSLKLSTVQSTRLLTILGSLPEGASRGPGSLSESEDACGEDAHRGYIAQFNYRSPPQIDVFIHIGGCDALSASNGSRTSKIDTALVSFLTSTVGYDSGFPDPTTLR